MSATSTNEGQGERSMVRGGGSGKRRMSMHLPASICEDHSTELLEGLELTVA